MWTEMKNNVDRIPEGIQRLIESNNLYIYGNGYYAENLYIELQKWNVSVEGVVVSDEYYETGIRFHELDVVPFGKLYKSIDVILAYNIFNHDNLNQVLVNSEKIGQIYFLGGIYALMNHMDLCNEIILLDDYYKILLNRKLDFSYFQDNFNKFMQTYAWMADEKSKMTMKCYLQGHIEVKDWPMIPVWNEKDVEKQYFPDDIIKLSQNEVFVDCGAFTGDTLETFNKLVNSFDRYYALEPDIERFEALNQIIESVGQKGEVIHLPLGVSDKDEKVYFSHSSAGCGQVIHHNTNGNDCVCIKLDRIDHILAQEQKVTFIKMDIEGEEMSALKGAKNIIQRDKPKLAICVYHKRDDLITIPQYIKSLVPEYQLFLRAHWPNASEIVLYGICG